MTQFHWLTNFKSQLAQQDQVQEDKYQKEKKQKFLSPKPAILVPQSKLNLQDEAIFEQIQTINEYVFTQIFRRFSSYSKYIQYFMSTPNPTYQRPSENQIKKCQYILSSSDTCPLKNDPNSIQTQPYNEINQPTTYPSEIYPQQQQAQTNSEYSEVQAILEAYNSPKTVMRPSSELFPNSKKLIASSQIPFSISVQPFGSPYGEETPVVSFGNHPLVRCERCRAYMNPFAKFVENGQFWKCNMCGSKEPVPNYYYAAIDSNGERVDKPQKPELQYGTFDIKAGADYSARPPVPPVYVFLIDVSKDSIDSGLLEQTVNTIKDVIQLDQLRGNERTQVAIITYDTHIHIYNLKQTMSMPQMVVITDSDDFTLPFPEDILINVNEVKDQLILLLDSLPNMFPDAKKVDTCLINAINVSIKIFRQIGGKLIVFQADSQIINLPQLKHKPPTQQENINKVLLKPSHPYFSTLSSDIHHNFINISFFIFSDSYKNLITLGDVVRYLNGDIFLYQNNTERSIRFYYDLRNFLTRDCTWESVFRLRVSAGWRVSKIFGNYSIKSTDLLNVISIDDNKTLIYELDLEDTIARDNTVYFQTALLYTNSLGERRIRVHNYGIELSSDTRKIHDAMDANVIGTHILRKALSKFYVTPDLQDIRTYLFTTCSQIVNDNIRSHPSKQSNINNLSQSLVTIPQIFLGMLKHEIFLNSPQKQDVALDYRSVVRVKLNVLSVEETIQYFVPFLFQVHTLEEENLSSYTDDGQYLFPSTLNLSAQYLTVDGIYLLDDTNTLYLYICGEVQPDLLQALIGVTNITSAEQLTEDNLYYNSSNSICTRLYNLINELRAITNKYSYLQIVKQGENTPQEIQFFYKLIEDGIQLQNSYNLSYDQFVKQIIDEAYKVPKIGNS